MQHTRSSAKKEAMATKQREVRQYTNKRRRKKQVDPHNEDDENETSKTEEKDETSMPATSSVNTNQTKAASTSDSVKVKAPVESSTPVSHPKVIVRNFTFPQFNSNVTPVRGKKNLNCEKPKQRWKQLCNLQHEMTTTLPMTKVKMLSSAMPLKREYCTGNLQNCSSGKVDVVSSTLEQLLSANKIAYLQGKEGNKSHTSPESKIISSEDSESQIETIELEEILDSAEEVSDVADIPSTGGTVQIESLNTLHSHVGLVGGKLVIFQQFDDDADVQEYNSKMNTIVPQNSVEKGDNKIGLKDPTSSLLRAKLIQGAMKPNSDSGVKEKSVCWEKLNLDSSAQKRINLRNLKDDFSPKEQSVVRDNCEQNVIWGKLINKSESAGKGQSVQSVDRVEKKHGSDIRENVIWRKDKPTVSKKYIENLELPEKKLSNLFRNQKDNSEYQVNQYVPEENLKSDNNVIVNEQKTENKILKRSFSLRDKTSFQGSFLESIQSSVPSVGNVKVNESKSPKNKEQSMSQLTSEHIVKEQNLKFNPHKSGNVIALSPLSPDTNKSLNNCFRDVSTKPVVHGSATESVKSVEKVAEDSQKDQNKQKKPLTLKQLHQEIALMKARQHIAMQVERNVFRAKNVKLVHEVLLPARRVLLSEVSTQTNLFSLVEPGRMVEMIVSDNSSSEKIILPSKMVNSTSKSGTNNFLSRPSDMESALRIGSVKKIVPGPFSEHRKSKDEDSGLRMMSEEPEKKKARLDNSSISQNELGASNVASESHVTAISSDTSVDSGIDITNAEFQNSVQSKNNLNVNPKIHTNSSSEGQSNIVNPNIANKPGRTKSDDNNASVFDIIVQHNIASQTIKLCKDDGSKPKLPQTSEKNTTVKEPGSTPMVYFPDSENANVNVSPKNNNNSEESSLKMTQNFMRQAYADWASCSISDDQGNIPLHKAVLNENLAIVKRQCVVLCVRKQKLDIPNFDKKTPLHLAILNGSTEIIKTLLGFGAQPTVKDSDGNTALHLAVLYGNLACFIALLNTKKLPINDFNDEGYSPLHLCALNNKLEESKALIAKGAEVNLKDAKSGRTALFHAVEANNGDMVKLLLAFDANPNESNFAGHTPLSAASEISFSSNEYSKEFVISDGMNFSSKLVSLSRGANVSNLLEDTNIIFGGELEDIELSDVMAANCFDSTSSNCNNSNNTWFMNEN